MPVTVRIPTSANDNRNGEKNTAPAMKMTAKEPAEPYRRDQRLTNVAPRTACDVFVTNRPRMVGHGHPVGATVKTWAGNTAMSTRHHSRTGKSNNAARTIALGGHSTECTDDGYRKARASQAPR